MSITINGNGTITGISVGGLPDGIVDTDMIAANAVTAAKASGSVKGITEADQWRLNTTLSNNGDNDITADWERNDNEFEKIGTGLSESSGVFSFPSTGKYLISFRGTGTGNGDRYIGVHFRMTTDGGTSYSFRGESYGSTYNSGSTTYTAYAFDTIVDVTSTSNFKFAWRASSSGTCNFLANTNAQVTGFTCIKIGET